MDACSQAATEKMLSFTGRSSLAGEDFLDIGCGSGLHSYAALRAGARKIHSLDYDPDSVRATDALHTHAARPDNWTFERGDILDDAYVEGLGKWSFVYSWGVLHHTGDMWRAIENAQKTVADGGLFYLALYSADADFQPSKEFWLEVKQAYNNAGSLKKLYMVYWYIWRFAMQRDLKRLPAEVRRIFSYRFKRGMSYFADIRDWLGGWPMEYAGDQETVDLLEKKHGFRLVNLSTGEANSEFLFERSGSPELITCVKAFDQTKGRITSPAPRNVVA
ncbi:class I SAM-dependent methyltransferase [Haliea sp. E17]|uniref:class I SAM-dependent methyltransferase n=1 Tax=Haliea sp. E17 TaxID=3401576 RepID=UPI003AB0F2CD